jgi:hypothetical protein
MGEGELFEVIANSAQRVLRGPHEKTLREIAASLLAFSTGVATTLARNN